MPSDFSSIEQNFPSFSGSESIEQKLNATLNYMRMLVEMLDYTLHNIKPENFNAAGITSLGNIMELELGKIEDGSVVKVRDIKNALDGRSSYGVETIYKNRQGAVFTAQILGDNIVMLMTYNGETREVFKLFTDTDGGTGPFLQLGGEGFDGSVKLSAAGSVTLSDGTNEKTITATGGGNQTILCAQAVITPAWSNIPSGIYSAPASACVVVTNCWGGDNNHVIKTRYSGGWQWCIAGTSGSTGASAICIY